MKKNVLFTASIYDHFTAFHLPFIELLQNMGCEVHAAGHSKSSGKEVLKGMGIHLHDIDFARLPFSRANRTARRELDRLFSEQFFDLIHTHTPTASFLTRNAASRCRQGKVLYTAHGFHFYKGAPSLNWLLFYPAEKTARKWTDGLLVMNKEDFSLGQKLGYTSGQNLFYVHGVGVDLTEYGPIPHQDEEIRKELGIGQDTVIVSCIAELSTRKNQRHLLSCWKEITAAHPNSCLVLAGDGADYERTRRFLVEEQLNNVHLLGFRTDAAALISASDIITLVSKHEGLPRCIMEAMAAGKTVVATNVRGSRDLVKDRVTGRLVELDDKEALISAITELMKDPLLREAFGRKGRERILDYSVGHVKTEMEEIYLRYLEQPILPALAK